VIVESISKLTSKDGNLKAQVEERLRAAILSGEVVAGPTYKMGEIADQLGVSRTPVREALMELEASGLVSITRSVGFQVSSLTTEEMREILDLRLLLEVPAMIRIAGRVGESDLQKAASLVGAIDEPARVNDLVGFLALDKEFHMFLIGLAGNARLSGLVSGLRDLQRVPGLLRLAEAGELLQRNGEHRAIVAAIADGDSEEVDRLTRNHLALSRQAWLGEE
jgi:DNA-binding GntR family transcriptional regulator